MTSLTPRVRMFAGPNGSGKSTIRIYLRPELVGVYVNPDEIQKNLADTSHLLLDEFQIQATSEEIQYFFSSSTLIRQSNQTEVVAQLNVVDNELRVSTNAANAYLASVAADFIRRKLIAAGVSFTFETVMSSADKIEVLKSARRQGYRTYLYFIATEDPEINISRIHNRVKLGGHDVPIDKVVSRYHRSLNLLMNAIRQTDRAYVFDNSGARQRWIAEITEGKRLELKEDQIPLWFQQSVLDKIPFVE